jgi:hypothetical protein
MYRDRLRDTTTSTGTGTITLSGTAPARFFAFSTLPQGAYIDYVIEAATGSEVEVGRGRVLAGNQLSRDEVLQSSNSGALVNFGAGTKNVYGTLAARSIVTNGKSAAMNKGYGVA